MTRYAATSIDSETEAREIEARRGIEVVQRKIAVTFVRAKTPECQDRGGLEKE